MALVNVAFALRKIGKTVLLVDWDFAAPGLHNKLGLEPGQGYVDYLAAFSAEERADQDSRSQRVLALRGMIQLVPPAATTLAQPMSSDQGWLKLLPAGDPKSAHYWRFTGSFSFQRVFYRTLEQLEGLSPQVFPDEGLGWNNDAFDLDKECIAEAAENPDYLLVDCKTSHVEQAVAPFLWADRIAHFLPVNDEGSDYALGTALALARLDGTTSAYAAERAFVPVVSRWSKNDKDDESRKSFSDQIKVKWLQEWAKLPGAEYPASLKKYFDEEHIVFLSEMPDLETDERPLIDGRDPKHDSLWELSHDYVALLARVAPNPDMDQTAWFDQEEQWYQQLAMRRGHRILSRYFQHLPHEGRLKNIDGQPNIAFQIETFHTLLQVLMRELSSGSDDTYQSGDATTQRVNDALTQAGRESGWHFGDELHKKFAQNPASGDAQTHLRNWETFDSRVGFGTLRARLPDIESAHRGLVIAIGDAFPHQDEIAAEENSPSGRVETRHWFMGYLAGVQERAFIPKVGETHVTLDVSLISKKDLSEDEHVWFNKEVSTFDAKESDVKIYSFEQKPTENVLHD